MRGIAGAILVLAGSILFAAGIVAVAVTTKSNPNTPIAYALGSVIGIVGLFMLVAGVLKRGWDAIPVDDSKTGREHGP